MYLLSTTTVPKNFIRQSVISQIYFVVALMPKMQCGEIDLSEFANTLLRQDKMNLSNSLRKASKHIGDKNRVQDGGTDEET